MTAGLKPADGEIFDWPSRGIHGSCVQSNGVAHLKRDLGGGPVFDPVVKFVNRYRARPRRIADRIGSAATKGEAGSR